MRFGIRRCVHYRNDNSTAKAIEIDIEIGRFALCLVLGL